MDSEYGKVWEIQFVNHFKYPYVVGGICVDESGYVLTTELGVHDIKKGAILELKGRTYDNRGRWLPLKIIYHKRNFNLTLLKVVKTVKTDNHFPYFDLSLDWSMDFEMEEELHGIFQYQKTPFGVRFGSYCHPFPTAEFPPFDMDSTKTVFNTKDSSLIEEALSEDVKCLCVGHIVGMDASDDDEESDEVPYAQPNLDCLDPNMPVIKCKGFGYSIYGCAGCPIFDAKRGLVGLYLFHQGKYEYIIPRPFLNAFVADAMPKIHKELRQKSLDQAQRLTHKLTTNLVIPHFTDAWFAHERLLPRLQDFGFYELEVQSNCQFRALAKLIYDSPDYHQHVRDSVVLQLKNDGEFYKEFVKIKYTGYLKKMAKSGEKGDYVTLQAAADVFGSRISLVTMHEAEEVACIIDIVPRGKDIGTVFWLSHWEKVYYNPLRYNRDGGDAGAGSSMEREKVK